MTLSKIAEVSEFEDTDRVLATIDGTEVGVIKTEEGYHAVRNVCPHQYGPVAEGKVQQKIVAEVPPVGERVDESYDEDRWVIRCPCHAWAFDISTGENIADPNNAPGVQVYDTEIKDGSVYVDM